MKEVIELVVTPDGVHGVFTKLEKIKNKKEKKNETTK